MTTCKRLECDAFASQEADTSVEIKCVDDKAEDVAQNNCRNDKLNIIVVISIFSSAKRNRPKNFICNLNLHSTIQQRMNSTQKRDYFRRCNEK